MVVGKVEAVKDVESGRTKFDSIEELDSKTSIYGNTAVTIANERITGQVGGKRFSSESRTSYVCVKRDGQWVVVLRQFTPIVPPKPVQSKQ